jgi:hypothetical protein
MKKWYESRTLWLNALVIAGGIAEIIDNQYSTGVAVISVSTANLILRFLTSQAIITGSSNKRSSNGRDTDKGQQQ